MLARRDSGTVQMLLTPCFKFFFSNVFMILIFFFADQFSFGTWVMINHVVHGYRTIHRYLMDNDKHVVFYRR